jgi:hypothetical protein
MKSKYDRLVPLPSGIIEDPPRYGTAHELREYLLMLDSFPPEEVEWQRAMALEALRAAKGLN